MSDDRIFHFRITLRDIDPPIWRQIAVPESATLDQLHTIIQCAMGWQSYQRFRFEIGDTVYVDAENADDLSAGDVLTQDCRLADVVDPQQNTPFYYLYDFTDNWEHDLELIEVTAPADDTVYPCCTGGERACPPEECGGPEGYADDFLVDPDDPMFADIVDGMSGPFDPEAFDLEAVNRRLDRVYNNRLPGIDANTAAPSFGDGGMERMMRKMHRLLEKHADDFDSHDELLAWVQQQMATGGDVADAAAPEEEAQELIYEAWEESDPRTRRTLAQQALELDPDCADAYLVLSELAPTMEESLTYLKQGAAAGERQVKKALGPHAFDDPEFAGHFWGHLETRPYMRIQYHLAIALALSDRCDEAISLGEESLRLNPNDNLGIRYWLLNWYLQEQRTSDAASLMKRFDTEDTARWLFPQALYLFQTYGDHYLPRRGIDAAVAANPDLPLELLQALQHGRLPDAPAHWSPGSEEEAKVCVAEGLAAWTSTAGAIDMLLTRLKEAIDEEVGRRTRVKVGRNEPCPCGSGRKYKKCCLNLEPRV